MITTFDRFINENFNFIGLNIKPEDYIKMANISIFRFHDEEGEMETEMEVDIDASATKAEIVIIDNLAKELLEGKTPHYHVEKSRFRYSINKKSQNNQQYRCEFLQMGEYK